MMLFPTPVSPIPIQTLGDVSAFMIEITAAHVSGGTAYHTFFVDAAAGCKVYWGDGASSTLVTGTNTCTHTYSRAGYYLIQLKGTHTLFRHVNLTIPAGHIVKAVKFYSGLTGLYYAFHRATRSDFKFSRGCVIGSHVTDITAMCYQATAGTDILYPEFVLPSNVRNAYWMMGNCYASAFELSSDFFPDWPSGATVNVSGIFINNYNMTGTAPADKLWNRTDITWTSTQAFTGCTKLTNYSSIPSGWK